MFYYFLWYQEEHSLVIKGFVKSITHFWVYSDFNMFHVRTFLESMFKYNLFESVAANNICLLHENSEKASA